MKIDDDGYYQLYAEKNPIQWNTFEILLLFCLYQAQGLGHLEFKVPSSTAATRTYFTHLYVVGLSVRLQLSVVQTVTPHTTELNMS